MTCTPPPEFADRDGWHWLELAGGRAVPFQWEHTDRQWVWTTAAAAVSSEIASNRGWRYVAPVATPEEVAALRQAAFLARKLEAALCRHTPYGERCLNPLACHATGRCPRDPVCGE